MNIEKMNCVVTTAHDPLPEMVIAAEAAALELGYPFADRCRRGNRSLGALQTAYGTDAVLLATRDGWQLHTSGGKLFFHLNMAHLRIKNLRAGQADHMAAAMRLTPGASVLDCTLGLASDAVIASFISGAGGKVTGLESSPITALIVRDGLRRFAAADEAISAALRRIEVIRADYHEYLAALPDKSYDIVYFDPMFRHPIQESVHLKPLRCVADHRAVTAAALAAARRVARQRVVFKENSRSLEFQRLAFDEVVGGKYSSVHYGVIKIDG